MILEHLFLHTIRLSCIFVVFCITIYLNRLCLMRGFTTNLLYSPFFWHRARTLGLSFLQDGNSQSKSQCPDFRWTASLVFPQLPGEKKRFDVFSGCTQQPDATYTWNLFVLYSWGFNPQKEGPLWSQNRVIRVLGRCVENNQPRTLFLKVWVWWNFRRMNYQTILTMSWGLLILANGHDVK